MDESKIRVWIGLTAYNDGHLVGRWVDFPKTPEELEVILKEINSKAEEVEDELVEFILIPENNDDLNDK